MIEEVETVPLRGRRAVWDGTNLDEIRELAGDRVLGVDLDCAEIRREDGRVEYVRPGWTVVRFDGITGPEGLLIVRVSNSPQFQVRVPADA